MSKARTRNVPRLATTRPSENLLAVSYLTSRLMMVFPSIPAAQRKVCDFSKSGLTASRDRSRSGLGGGRTWWAHFEFTRINIEPIILRKKFEDLRPSVRFVFPARNSGSGRFNRVRLAK